MYKLTKLRIEIINNQFFHNLGTQSGLRQRRHRTPSCDSAEEGIKNIDMVRFNKRNDEDARWKRILLLIVAITGIVLFDTKINFIENLFLF